MNYVIDANTLNVCRYYINTINFEWYDFPLRVDQRRRYLLDIIVSLVPPTLTIAGAVYLEPPYVLYP